MWKHSICATFETNDDIIYWLGVGFDLIEREYTGQPESAMDI